MFQDQLYIGNYKTKYKKKHPPKLENFSDVVDYSLNRFRTPLIHGKNVEFMRILLFYFISSDKILIIERVDTNPFGINFPKI
ncbi:hypothetical protein DZB88_26950 [Bacillus sp. OE]|nr:hypothetical protein DZB88_26950 [Bacillus sp. OE]